MAKADFAAAMPNMLAHEGEWEGTYRHLDAAGSLLDQHHMWTWCEFPDAGPYAYIQHNRLRWDDGRTADYEFGGVFRNGVCDHEIKELCRVYVSQSIHCEY